MNPLLARAFRAAHQSAVAELADPEAFLWWPTAPDATTYGPPIPALRGTLRAQQQGMAGILVMANDGITLNALKEDFPITPLLDELFLLGPASPSAPALPDLTACKTYRLTACTSADIAAHYHLTAELHV